ncbi:mechanosensitive ion channel family protein [Amylibacter sp. IMCC11727]|uniref:mechanosensitive ion channel family protein n=1 Tax=Amylibacter sp. IMCC11727 TaxID=3039851 RepID=UPI00244DA86D|nr:mechanosensitive ion channel family protein [Amylibacter sp. IMCC11727]WGI21398.1 mechanosensitive ion channel family protein [Amylibacter sp. IMCC11727]
MRFTTFWAALAVILTLFAVQPVSAQTLIPTSGGGESSATDPVDAADLTPEDVRDMVSRMSDADVRNMLLERLDAVAKKEEEVASETSVLDFLMAAANGTWTAVYEAIVRLPILISSQATSFSNFYNTLGGMGILQLLGSILLGLAVGLVAEKLVNWLTRNWHTQTIGDDATLFESLKFLSFRLLKQIYGLIAFFAVARLVTTNLITPDMAQFAQVIVFNVVALPRLALALGRFLLAPERPEHRLIATDDWTAKYLYRNQFGLFLLMGLSTGIVEFNALNDVPMGTSRLGFWLNLSVHIYIIVVAWRAWDGLVTMARGRDDVTPFEDKLAKFYPVYLIGLSVFTWLLINVIVSFGMFEVLATAPHYKMMFLLAFGPTFDTAVRALVRHLVPPMQGEGFVAERAYVSTKRSYIRIGRVVVFAIIIVIIAEVWGIDLSNLAAAGVGVQVAGRMIEILMVIAVGYLVWELVSLWINRKLAAEQTALGIDLNDEEPGGGEGGGAGGSRLSTVLPLVLGIAKFAIAAIFGLIALGNIGIDITPLLAGAGIIGLAVGFGAQKLVADIVSGMFFLIDDAFRTGEYVEVEGTMGTVEKISIRSMQLRHHRGLVHTIPYGEIPKLTNFSRDWVIMKLMFTVPFDTDPNKVKKIFKKIGNEMMAEDAWKDDFLQPFKSQGVFGFDDVGMVMRGKFMAKPGRQFMARKEIYNRVKAEFDAAGIDFARREVRVAIPGLDSADALSAEQKTAIEAAATEVAAQEQEKLDQAAKDGQKK